MKILLFSDVHFREYSQFVGMNSFSESGFTREINNILKGCKFVSDSIKEFKPDIVVNLGDTIHIPTGMSLRLMKSLDIGIGFIEESCFDNNTPLYHLNGNHDSYSEDINLSSFFNHRYGDYFTEPYNVKFRDKVLRFIPYSDNKEHLFSNLSIDYGNDTIIFCHEEFSGSVYDSGIPSPSIIRNSSKNIVISGHIHKPQFSEDVFYVGSLISMNFVSIETPVIHGITLFDTDTLEFKRIPNTYSKHYIRINSIEELKSLDKDKFIIKLYTDEKEINPELISNHDIIVLRNHKKSEDIKKEIKNKKSNKDSFREYLESENPDSVEIFDRHSKDLSF